MVIHMALENAWSTITGYLQWQRNSLSMEMPATWATLIDECSFYARDWDRKIDPAKEYRDEWMFMDAMKGDVFIEYIYIYKDNRWYVSTQKHYKTKDGYDRGVFMYYTKFEPVIMNKEYIKYKDKHEKHAEVKMISQIGNLLSKAGFDGDNIAVQGGKAKKSKLIPIC
jgi:hypothetical protein